MPALQTQSSTPALGVQGRWDIIPNGAGTAPASSGVVGIHANVLHTDRILFFERPECPPNPNTGGELSAVFDPSVATFTTLHVQRNPFCAGQAFLPDGRLLVMGGDMAGVDGLNALRAFTPSTAGPGQWSDVGTISGPRWYPTCISLPDGRVFIISGTTDDQTAPPNPPNLNPTYEVIPPLPTGPSPALDFLINAWPYPLYPFVHVLPSGWLFVFVAQSTRFINLATWAIESRGVADLPPGPRTYNKSGTSVLLPLSPANGYDAEVMVLGGATDDGTQQASNTFATMRVDAGPTPQWVSGTMPSHRVMADAVLLPDGTVLVVNGASVGVAGGEAGHGDTGSAGNPVHQADLYDPATRNWTSLASATVNRLYHSTAFLLPDGRVMTAGCDQKTATFACQQPPPAGAPPYEYRLEAFSPPYLFSATPRPVIWGAPDKVMYGLPFAVQVDDPSAVDRAALIRPATVTHGNSMNQRYVELRITGRSGNTLTFAAPPNANIAPPGYYMLFLLNQGVPSVARYVRLVDTPIAALGAVATGLAGRWSLGEGGGATAGDSSGNGHNGTIHGDYAWIQARSGWALHLNGAGHDGYVDASAAALPAAATPRTVAAWFKLDTVPNPEEFTLFCWGNPTSNGANGLSILPTGAVGPYNALRFFGWDNDLDAPVILSPNVWYHVAATYDGMLATIYLDGKALSTAARPGWNTASGASLYIGRDPAPQNRSYFHGALSDVRVYDRVLSPSEVQALVSPIPPAGLALWLRADTGVVADSAGLVSSWADQSGNDCDALAPAVPLNAPTWTQAAFNALPALRFNGMSSYLQTVTALAESGAGPYAIFVVARPTASGIRGFLGWGQYGTQDAVVALRLDGAAGATTANLKHYWWANDLTTTTPQPLGPALLEANFDGTSRHIRRNGADLASDTPAGKNTAATPATIGCTNFQGNVGYEYLQGDIAEILIYNVALSAADQGAVETYLRNKYNLW